MAAAFGRRIGVGLTECNLIRRDTELRRGNLREGRFMALPVGLSPNRQYRAPIRGKGDSSRIRRRTQRRLEVVGHPDTAARVALFRQPGAMWKSADIGKRD